MMQRLEAPLRRVVVSLIIIFPFCAPHPSIAASGSLKGDPKRGEEIYQSLCWTCHGRYGRGDGPAAQYLANPPPDFTDPKILGAKSDQALLAWLSAKSRASAPHDPMAVIGQILKEESARNVIAYIRSLSVPGKHVSIQAGRDIYNTFCWTCHGKNGNGQGPAAKNLVGAKPKDFTAKDFTIQGHEDEIRQTVFEGAAKAFHGSPYMPEWKTTLSREQILDVVEYLKTFKQ